MKTYTQLMEEIKHTAYLPKEIPQKPVYSREEHVFDHPNYRILLRKPDNWHYLDLHIYHTKKNVDLGGMGYKDYGSGYHGDLTKSSWGSKAGGLEFEKHKIKEKEAREIFQHVSNHVKDLGWGKFNPDPKYHTGEYWKPESERGYH
jgi:hypothetical protein